MAKYAVKGGGVLNLFGFVLEHNSETKSHTLSCEKCLETFDPTTQSIIKQLKIPMEMINKLTTQSSEYRGAGGST